VQNEAEGGGPSRQAWRFWGGPEAPALFALSGDESHPKSPSEGRVHRAAIPLPRIAGAIKQQNPPPFGRFSNCFPK
jgi:hypothetical protein